LKVESGKKIKKEFYTEGHRGRRGHGEEGESRRKKSNEERMKKRTQKKTKRDFSLRRPTRLQEQT